MLCETLPVIFWDYSDTSALTSTFEGNKKYFRKKCSEWLFERINTI